MKKFMALALVAMMILACTAVFAEDVATEDVMAIAEEVEAIAEEAAEATIIMLQINNTRMFVNDEQIDLDVPAQLINDRTMVPLRAIFEALDAKVEWDDETQTVTAYRGTVSISLQIGSTSLFVNRVEKVIDVPAQLVDARTLVPVRAIAESFGSKVGWIAETKTVTITD